MKNPTARSESVDSGWKGLYTAGGAAALAAGILFRRNLGVEIGLFAAQKPPDNAADWFGLLQSSRLLGLAYLNLFDVVNYLLVAVMLLALYVLLRQAHQGSMAIAAALGLLGIGLYCATNTALSMLALSGQYAASGEEQRAGLEAAGQALLALSRFGAGPHPGTGGYFSLLLVAAAGLTISIVMLRSGAFNRATAIVGLLANGLDLAYCLAYAFMPGADAGVLAVTFIPAAGLFYMAWHILTGIRLVRLGRVEKKAIAEAAARG